MRALRYVCNRRALEDAKVAKAASVEETAAAATARTSVARKSLHLRPTVELLYDPEDGTVKPHWLADIVFMFTLPVPVSVDDTDTDTESEPYAFVQWHQFVKVAAGVDVDLPCNVTQIGEEYTVVKWCDIVKQFS